MWQNHTKKAVSHHVCSRIRVPDAGVAPVQSPGGVTAATRGAAKTLTLPAETGPSLHPTAAMAGLTGCMAERHLLCMAKAADRVCKSPEGEAMRTESTKMATVSRKEGGQTAVRTDTMAEEMSSLCDIMTGAVFRLKCNSPR